MMFTILLHSSKTMRVQTGAGTPYRAPQLLRQAEELAGYLQSLSIGQIAASIQLSRTMAEKTFVTLQAWSTRAEEQLPAIDAFIGDIYSGLQVSSLSAGDRTFADKHLYILSGLYGVVRALDTIAPYRLEMGYRLPDTRYRNLYHFWGDAIAGVLPAGRTIINLSAAEYAKAVLPYVPDTPLITPRFLTMGKAGEPAFVTVHAKIARGAFARWLIKNRIRDTADLEQFNELNYVYEAELSTAETPVFVCQTFGGLGLSVRLA